MATSPKISPQLLEQLKTINDKITKSSGEERKKYVAEYMRVKNSTTSGIDLQKEPRTSPPKTFPSNSEVLIYKSQTPQNINTDEISGYISPINDKRMDNSIAKVADWNQKIQELSPHLVEQHPNLSPENGHQTKEIKLSFLEKRKKRVSRTKYLNTRIFILIVIILRKSFEKINFVKCMLGNMQ